MVASWRAGLAALLPIAACSTPRAGCPPEAFIGEAHAAAFYLQHGPLDAARTHLERARAVAPPSPDRTSAKVLAALIEISSTADRDPSAALREVEAVRVELGDWSCLPEALHQRLHAALPPLR